MTRDTKDNTVRYIADYERYYSDELLYVGSERENIYVRVPKYFDKDYVNMDFIDSYVVACTTSSSIRPLLYLIDSSFRKLFQNQDSVYGILKA